MPRVRTWDHLCGHNSWPAKKTSEPALEALGWREMADKMHWAVVSMGLAVFHCSPRCTLFPTLSPALPKGCSHCPFLPSCLLPSPLVLTSEEWQPQLLCLLGLGPTGRYYCQPHPQLSGPQPSRTWGHLGMLLSLFGPVCCRATCATESRPISTAI